MVRGTMRFRLESGEVLEYPHILSQTAEELRQRLVDDAVSMVATPLVWAVPAYERIAKMRKMEVDLVFQDVVSTVHDLTGRGMPVI